MPNTKRKSSVYNLDLSPELIEALITIAHQRDVSFSEVVNQAMESYIEKELREWQQQQRN